jgi:hypothetical protein
MKGDYYFQYKNKLIQKLEQGGQQYSAIQFIYGSLVQRNDCNITIPKIKSIWRIEF